MGAPLFWASGETGFTFYDLLGRRRQLNWSIKYFICTPHPVEPINHINHGCPKAKIARNSELISDWIQDESPVEFFVTGNFVVLLLKR